MYTHSFLCYGKDQALQQKLARDLQASTSTPVIEQSWALPALGYWCCKSCCVPAHLLVWIREMSLFSIQTGHQVPKEVTVDTFKSTTNLRCLDSWAWDSKITDLTEVLSGDDILPSWRNPNQQHSFTNCDLK